MGTVVDYPIRSKPGEPAWELATLYPTQGRWTVGEYLAIETNRLIEYDHGVLEFLTMPTRDHQDIVAFLWQLVNALLLPRGGKAWFAPIRMQVAEETFREPDLMAFLDKADRRAANKFFTGADLVMEVVSDGPEDRERDYVKKREDYETAHVPEYWIVDPKERTITVLSLRKGKYAENAVCRDGTAAESVVVKGLKVDVSRVFNPD